MDGYRSFLHVYSLSPRILLHQKIYVKSDDYWMGRTSNNSSHYHWPQSGELHRNSRTAVSVNKSFSLLALVILFVLLMLLLYPSTMVTAIAYVLSYVMVYSCLVDVG